MGPDSVAQLSGLLDLPPSYGGTGLQSVERSADEEFLGSFAGISAKLIAFCRKTELSVYISIAEALDYMGDAAGILEISEEADKPGPLSPIPVVCELSVVAARTLANPPPRKTSPWLQNWLKATE